MGTGENIFIYGFAITHYRSFGEPEQYLGPFSKINFFVGQNNSGKSNVLKFISQNYRGMVTNARQNVAYSFENLNLALGATAETSRSFSLPIIARGNHFESVVARAKDSEVYESFLSSYSSHSGTDDAWIKFESKSATSPFLLSEESIHIAQTSLSEHEWLTLWSTLIGGKLVPHILDCIRQCLNEIIFEHFVVPEAVFISAHRKIGHRNSEIKNFDGDGIIERLAQLQNPNYENLGDGLKFDQINNFLKKVIGNPSARIQIPGNKEQILVNIDGQILPLEDLGTGLHEVIILAAASTLLENQIVCIEEPELHLHPLLQKKLIRYLEAKTTNQYFFSTHSAHILDTPGSAIFHIRKQEGKTIAEKANTPSTRSSVCMDLGYVASDLLQSNCIIWVEGPTDRIYLNHWISAVDPKLEEGIHYSIMFYGGRLLSHLKADDSEINDFISLRRLNRYISILIDSDKRFVKDKINETKSRIRREFDKSPGFCWITQGREIENYIDSNLLATALESTCANFKDLLSKDPFDHCYHYRTSTGEVRSENIDKVKIAHAVVKERPNLNVLDLKSKISKLVKFIRSSNDLEPYFLSD